MEWSDIKVFLQVVRCGTIAAATGPLRMDHSTISRKIARLEKSAGVPLFEHAGRRLKITEEGSRLAAAAEKLESIILREVASLSESRSSVSGRVRIGCTEEFGVHYLASRLPSITGGHAGLEIELVTLPRVQSLATHEVDLLITMDRPSTGNIRFKKLTTFALGLYGVADYFGDNPRPNSTEDLMNETWCGYIPELLHTPELDLASNAPETVAAKYRTTSLGVQIAAALSGHSLATLPCFVAKTYPKLERLLHRERSFIRNYWIAVHEDLADSLKVRAVMNAIDQQVSRDKILFQDCAEGRSELHSYNTAILPQNLISAKPVNELPAASLTLDARYGSQIDRLLSKNLRIQGLGVPQ